MWRKYVLEAWTVPKVIHATLVTAGCCLLFESSLWAQREYDSLSTPAIYNNLKRENQLLEILFYDIMQRSPSPQEASWLQSHYGGVSQKEIAYTGLINFLLDHPQAQLPTDARWQQDTLGIYKELFWRFFTVVPTDTELKEALRFFREQGLPPVRKFVYEALTSERYLLP